MSDQIVLSDIISKSQAKLAGLQSVVKENKTYYLECMKLIDYILAECEKSKSIGSVGTQNLIADLEDKLEGFKFKMKQRVK